MIGSIFTVLYEILIFFDGFLVTLYCWLN